MASERPKPLTKEREIALRAWVSEFWPNKFDEDDDGKWNRVNVGRDIAECLASIDEARSRVAELEGQLYREARARDPFGI